MSDTKHLWDYQSFRPGEVRATGWMNDQLNLQYKGLSGTLDEFWPDIMDSAWFGGKADGWERAPYWLDGLIPLATVSGNEQALNKLHRRMDALLRCQTEEGRMTPQRSGGKATDEELSDPWSDILVLKVINAYAPIDPKGDRSYRILRKALWELYRRLLHKNLNGWSHYRYYDALGTIHDELQREPEPWLWNLASRICAQGFDWAGYFERWEWAESTPKGEWNFLSHVVNNAQALRSGTLRYLFNGKEEELVTGENMLEQLMRHHGMAAGTFTGDECLAGKSPTQGTELCGVVEMMDSLAMMAMAKGECRHWDHLDRVALNALPATLAPDMNSHQYLQQSNQVQCIVSPDAPWTTNGEEAHLFGLEPHFGCCTSNMHQGWPKYAHRQWLKGKKGIALTSFCPSRLNAHVNGKKISAECRGDYPFSDRIQITVKSESDEPFELAIRVPAWAVGPKLIFGDKTIPLTPGQLFCMSENWRGGRELQLDLPSKPVFEQGPGGGTVLSKGPLVYALKIQDEWTPVTCPKDERPEALTEWDYDYELRPLTEWNLALDLTGITPDSLEFEFRTPLAEQPFSPENAPVSVRVPAKQIPAWKINEHGVAGTLPENPHKLPGTPRTAELIPYGCTNLRVTEFPVIR